MILKTLVQNYTSWCKPFEKHGSNYSLRATAATCMFSSGIPEKVIAEVTGYKSTKTLRQYVKTSIEQEQAAGMAIQRCESKPSVTDLNDCFP